jgi:phosphatidylglycerol:prolipoprotein diacylglycerol transferase
MFGLFVALALTVATIVVIRDVRRAEAIGRLPANAHTLVGDLAIVTFVAGIVGARVFHILDYVEVFLQNPASMIFTRGGFSIYGGICFGIGAGVIFVRRHGLPVVPMLDAVAPALMLAYGIGRIGCQVSGDGDWGIAADLALKPDWLPTWLWAQKYEGNILGVPIPSPGVYPTPLYETVAALVIYGALRLWTRSARPVGSIFALYLTLAGFERLLVEKIRINVRFAVGDMMYSQAEMISVVIVLLGSVWLMRTLPARQLWLRFGVGVGLLALLSACVVLK